MYFMVKVVKCLMLNRDIMNLSLSMPEKKADCLEFPALFFLQTLYAVYFGGHLTCRIIIPKPGIELVRQ